MLPAPGEVRYTTATGFWRHGGVLSVYSVADTRIALFPMKFLEASGDNTWAYVQFVVSLLVDEDPEHPGAILTEEDEIVDPSSAPTAGRYKFIEQGESFMRSISYLG
jgi:hypothetical protein